MMALEIKKTKINAFSFVTWYRPPKLKCFCLSLSRSNHDVIDAVRKIGIPREEPRFIKARNFRHFNESKFRSDFKVANWSSIVISLALMQLGRQ